MAETSDLLLLTVLLALSSISIVVTMVAFLVFDRRRNSRRKSEVLLDLRREDTEDRVYRLMERMVANRDEWLAVNHLLASSAVEEGSTASMRKAPVLSDFLKSMGLKDEDMIVDSELIFVLTPFHRRYQATYRVITTVCQKHGLRCERGDEVYIRGEIFPHILKSIAKARLIICNVDGRNPNVYYELGLAQAMDKTVILVSREDPATAPFDLRSRSIVFYQNGNDLQMKLSDAIVRVLLDAEGRQAKRSLPVKSGIERFPKVED